MAKAMFAFVAVLLALSMAYAGRGLTAPMLPPLPIDPRTEALAATITTADSLAAAVPLFSSTIMGHPTTAVQMDAFAAAAPAAEGTMTVYAPANAPEAEDDDMATSMAPSFAPAGAPEESTRPPIALAPGSADAFAAMAEMAPGIAPGVAPEEDDDDMAPGMAPGFAPAGAPEESTRPPIALAPGTADGF